MSSIVAYILPEEELHIDLAQLEALGAFSYHIEFRPQQSNVFQIQKDINIQSYSIVIPSRVLGMRKIIESILMKYLVFFSQSIVVEQVYNAKKQVDQIFSDNWAMKVHWKKGQNYYKCYNPSKPSLIIAKDIQLLERIHTNQQHKIFAMKMQNAYNFCLQSFQHQQNYHQCLQMYKQLINRIPKKFRNKLEQQYYEYTAQNLQRMLKSQKYATNLIDKQPQFNTEDLIDMTHQQIFNQIYDQYNTDHPQLDHDLKSMKQLYVNTIDVFCETTRQDTKTFKILNLLIENIFDNLEAQVVNISKKEVQEKIQLLAKQFKAQKEELYVNLESKQAHITSIEQENTQLKQKLIAAQQQLVRAHQQINATKIQKKQHKSSLSGTTLKKDDKKQKSSKNIKQNMKQKVIIHEKKQINLNRFKSNRSLSQISLKSNILKAKTYENSSDTTILQVEEELLGNKEQKIVQRYTKKQATKK